MVFITQPSITLDSSFLAYSYQLFTEGNQMYERLDKEQTNYCAPEIFEHPRLGLTDIAEEEMNINLATLLTFCWNYKCNI